MTPGRPLDRRATGAVARVPWLGRDAAPHGSDRRRPAEAPARASGEASSESPRMRAGAHRRSPVISRSRRYPGDAGWSSLVARWAHNPEVTGSNPVPATAAPAQTEGAGDPGPSRSRFFPTGEIVRPSIARPTISAATISAASVSCAYWSAVNALDAWPRAAGRDAAGHRRVRGLPALATRWAFPGSRGCRAPGLTPGRWSHPLSSKERPRPGSGHSSRTAPGSLRPRAFEVNDSPQPDPPCGGLHDCRSPPGSCPARPFAADSDRHPASATARSHLRPRRCR